MWTIHEMVRCHGKLGDFEAAHRLFEDMMFERSIRPTSTVFNSMLEVFFFIILFVVLLGPSPFFFIFFYFVLCGVRCKVSV